MGPQTITLASALPGIFDSVVVDGTTQPGFAGLPIVEINGGGANCLTVVAANSTIRGLVVNRCAYGIQLLGTADALEGSYVGTDVSGTAAMANVTLGVSVGGTNNRVGGSTAGARNVISGNTNAYGVAIADAPGAVVQGNYIGTDVTGSLPLQNFYGVYVSGTSSSNTITGNVIAGSGNSGVVLDGTGVTANTVKGNFVGTDATGAVPIANAFDGIDVIRGAASNIIGGTAASDRNVVAGNTQAGISIPSGGAGNVVEGNYIGTNAAGTAALPNVLGVLVSTDGTMIGGSTAGAGNVISGNSNGGIVLSASGCTIAGNFVGTNASGSAALKNDSAGISFGSNASNNTIGGMVAAARNVISGNGGGAILIASSTSSGNTIAGNFVGTDITGSFAIPNEGGGIFLTNGSLDTTVGGVTAAARNVISGNAVAGLYIAFGATAVVQGNFIGTDSAGSSAVANAGDGIDLLSVTNVTVGGAVAGAGNLVSGNTGAGIAVGIITTPPSGMTIAGNLIGTNAAGTAAIPNLNGITLDKATNCTIGGTTTAARNVISGNSDDGVSLTFSDNNLVEGNYIGVTSAGTGALGNGGTGIRLTFSSNNAVGGTAAGASNVIRFNRNGVGVEGGSSSGDSIRLNSMSDDQVIGIYLGIPVIIPNDSGDADSGPNTLQNFPVVTGAVLKPGTTVVSGTLNSTASKTFTIDVYDNAACHSSGNGEGLTWVGSTPATTDASGNASWTLTVPTTMNVVTTTATDASGNTSGFSQCRTASVITNVLTIADSSLQEGNSGTAPMTFTVTLTPAATVTTTVQYATADNTANAPADYLASSGTLTFAPGESTKSIAVQVVGDPISEPNDESFFVNLSNATNAGIGDGQAVGTIVDDDPTGFTVDNPVTYDGLPAVFTITLINPSEIPLSILAATQDGTALAGTDYASTSVQLTFAPGQLTQTVSVPTILRTALGGAKTFSLILSGGLVVRSPGVATIYDAQNIPALSPWLLALLAALLAALGILVLKP